MRKLDRRSQNPAYPHGSGGDFVIPISLRYSSEFLDRGVGSRVGGYVHYGAMSIPLTARIWGNYPFAELRNLGWQLDKLSEPFRRLPGRDPVRTAHFSWGNSNFTFDVDEAGHMSEFATFSRDEDIMLVADTPQAVVLLAASSPKATLEKLCAISDVTDFHRRHES